MIQLSPLGLDMEWRVIHRKAERKTALVQLSDENIILMIQVSAMARQYYFIIILVNILTH
jgi:hypothetical protein